VTRSHSGSSHRHGEEALAELSSGPDDSGSPSQPQVPHRSAGSAVRACTGHDIISGILYVGTISTNVASVSGPRLYFERGLERCL
jgi:hypothetical protein